MYSISDRFATAEESDGKNDVLSLRKAAEGIRSTSVCDTIYVEEEEDSGDPRNTMSTELGV